jgi:hypothetical protein
MKVKVAEAEGIVLDWLVAKCEGLTPTLHKNPYGYWVMPNIPGSYSTDWSLGGPIIEKANITIIRANDEYEVDAKGLSTSKPIPCWFAECSRWTGHSLTTSYEGESMEPTFMIGELDGCYGATPLIAAMRCLCCSKLGDVVDIPEELCQQQRS